MTQTRDGYLWLTTFDGLVRYDGVRFTIFNRSNSQGLTSNRFSALFEDTDGTLWLGTIDGGLIRFRDGIFTSFTTADGLPANWVHSSSANPAGVCLSPRRAVLFTGEEDAWSLTRSGSMPRRSSFSLVRRVSVGSGIRVD